MRSSYEHFADSLREILSAPVRYITIIAFPALVYAVASVIQPPVDANGDFAFVANKQMYQYLMATALTSLVSLFLYSACTFAIAERTAGIALVFKNALHSFFKYLGMNIVMALILLFAFLLLIIPGIWLSVSLTFAGFFLLLRGSSITLSLKESYSLVKGRWAEVFARLIMLAILSILLALPFVIVFWILESTIGTATVTAIKAASSAVGTLLTVIYTYKLFIDLESSRTVETQKEPEVQQ